MAQAYPILTCTPKRLPPTATAQAARVATEINPMNHPRAMGLLDFVRSGDVIRDAQRIGALTTKYWHTNGVKLTVGFLDNPPAALRRRIISHMNAWSKTANVKFTETKTDPQVRIARQGGADGGYWSYLGTDVLLIPKDEPTMNLEEFTMDTPESEFHRVVRHETGHTLGFPHEHMRKALVNQIDRAKAFKFFQATQGWSQAEVIAQVLTPIEESALLSPTAPDPNSIMCYQIPGQITKTGKPIIGGVDIDPLDFQYAGKIYPKKTAKPGAMPKVELLRSGSTKKTKKRALAAF